MRRNEECFVIGVKARFNRCKSVGNSNDRPHYFRLLKLFIIITRTQLPPMIALIPPRLKLWLVLLEMGKHGRITFNRCANL